MTQQQTVELTKRKYSWIGIPLFVIGIAVWILFFSTVEQLMWLINAGYLIFFAWLLVLSALAYKKVPVLWKTVLIGLWLVILAGQYLLFFRPDESDVELFLLAGLLIGIAIAAFAVPLSIASSSSGSPDVRQPSSLKPEEWSTIKWFCVVAGFILFVFGFLAFFTAIGLILPVAFLFQVAGVWLATKSGPRSAPAPDNADSEAVSPT